jgi:hypothetical protein
MSEPKTTEDEPTQITRGGASGRRLNLRKGIQAFVLVAFFIILFTGPASLDRRAFIFGTMILVVLVDLVLLLRGDLDWTHFQSRQWSLRINLAMLAIAIALFALALTDRW